MSFLSMLPLSAKASPPGAETVTHILGKYSCRRPSSLQGHQLNADEDRLNVDEHQLSGGECLPNVDECLLNIEEILLNDSEDLLNANELQLNNDKPLLNVGESLLDINERLLKRVERFEWRKIESSIPHLKNTTCRKSVYSKSEDTSTYIETKKHHKSLPNITIAQYVRGNPVRPFAEKLQLTRDMKSYMLYEHLDH